MDCRDSQEGNKRKVSAAHQLINQTSGEIEWFTPIAIIEAATACMGFIDLDPASCTKANREIVGARRIFTKEDDGLSREWRAKTVWLNHPFGRESTPKWINKLLWQFDVGRFEQACAITYASTSEKWFQPLLKFPQCFIHSRTNYISADTLKPIRGASKGSVVTYLGPNLTKFWEAFHPLGTVKIKY